MITGTDRTHSWSRFATSAGWLALIGVAFLTGLFAAGGMVVLQKGLLYLAMPAGLTWLTLSFLLLQLRDQRRSPLFVTSCLAWLLLTVLGNGIFADFLMRRLEADYLTIKPKQEQPYDVIVVLGGGCSQGANGEVQVNAAGERVVQAARMYHAGRARRIVCTGKRIAEFVPDGVDPADQTAQTLMDLNVPASAIRKIGGINTSQEMKNLARHLNGNQRAGLITSAWHLPRAMRLAESEGLTLQPLPGGFRSRERQTMTVSGMMMSVIPTGDALVNSTWCMREILAGLVGR